MFNAGTNTKLKEDDAYYRLGPKLTLELWPTFEWLERLSFNVNWAYLEGFTGSPSASHLFEAGAKIALDRACPKGWSVVLTLVSRRSSAIMIAR